MYHIVKTKDGKNHTISVENFDDICEVVKEYCGDEFEKVLLYCVNQTQLEYRDMYYEAQTKLHMVAQELEQLAKSRRDIAEICEVARSATTVKGKDAIINLIEKEANS